MLDKETRQLVNAARTLGSGPLSIYLEDDALLRLCAVIAVDLGMSDILDTLVEESLLADGYYAVPLAWFSQPVTEGNTFEDVFVRMRGVAADFPTYFKSLCELHKRRLKFQLILERQSLPPLEAIVPRCLLEYGVEPSASLASWLVWRKWLYDIDNRSAQETGYLFEPILTAALGGVSYAASKSPVRRADDRTKGRQVDCIDGKTAYEFKMRVTIAASGQGRFKEELDFARDCHVSGFTPVLLVLDPTPSTRLTELTRAYAEYNGRAYIGDDAWRYIEEAAGQVVGQFVERYIRIPLREVDMRYRNLQPIRLEQTATAIEVRIGDARFAIPRLGPQVDLTGIDDKNQQAPI
jgi:hypothetical protein